MKALFFSIGDLQIASSRTRIYEFIPYFEEKGTKVKVIPFVRYLRGEDRFPFKGIAYSTRLSRILSLIHQSGFYDVTVVQRMVIPRSLLLLLGKRNPNLVLDIDDAIYDTFSTSRFTAFVRSLQLYKALIVSNSFLKTALQPYAKRLMILPTCVNTDYFKPTEPTQTTSRVKIGWIGTPHTEKYLFLAKKPLQILAERYKNIEFHIISTGEALFNHIPVINKKWNLKNEVRDLAELNIGIMPLTEGRWEQAKSGYKILQYMAMGIPVVASGVGINKELIKHGETGFIANTQQEWIQYLALLIQDCSLRFKMGKQGREWVVKHFDHRVHFQKFYDLLRSLCNQEVSAL